MKKLGFIVLAVCISVLAASSAEAQRDYQLIGNQEGVEVLVRYNPLGSNNLIVAFIKFVNKNEYKVHVAWTPLISCGDLPPKKGYGEPFSLQEKGTYEVNIWRSQACGQEPLKGIRVEMHLKKEGW